MTLAVGRELITAAGGRVHVEVDGRMLPDRGWGDDVPAAVDAGAGPDVEQIEIMELVQAAGLHRHVLPAADHVTVLAPARRLTALAQRSMDLGLTICHRLVRLDQLFDEGRNDRPSMFEVQLTAPSGSLPAALLAALNRDPSVLACRRPAERLLIQNGLASALPDRRLAELAARESGNGTWLLADVGFGSARLVPMTELRDGSSLVRLSDQHRLGDIDDGWETHSGPVANPEPAPLRLVRTRSRATVDAVLLDDADLSCLPALLVGRPLADLALLARGRDRHLMLAPGGVLEQLPVGEPLYRLGPGPLFLPLGYRIQPSLPPSARDALFQTTPETALVMQETAILEFPLERKPVWTLWAGALPPVDRQLPPDARRALAEVDQLTTAAPTPEPPRKSAFTRLSDRLAGQVRGPSDERPRTWRDEALEAELADDLVRAAELCERNGEVRRAAHLYERAAHQPARTLPEEQS
jgi:hypothetical protein